MKNSVLLLAWLTGLGGFAPLSIPIAQAQTRSITPATDGTGTIVTPQGNRFDIGGGRSSGDGANLFQSFDRFGLNQGEVANFLASPTVRNILGRVVGGDPSAINGLIQVTGGAANLYLLNPAGIVFGANASLNVPASFTATTANGIGFGNGQWFNAIGSADYTTLIGTPNAFAFTSLQPGAIANLGNLAVSQGQSLTLLGGTVLNTGQLTAPGGQITIAAVPGQTLVRLSQQGNLLSLEFSPLSTQAPLPDSSAPPTLPQLLTGGNLGNATGIAVNPDGTLQLTGSTARLSTAPGTAIVSGQVSVASNAPPATPASLAQIAVLGDRVSLQAATLDASGLNGGTVRIGGAYQGQETLPNARFTDVDANTIVHADAIAPTGNGGTIVAWSNDTTNVAGTITARGGSNGGNGGLVETSGKQTLMVAPTASVSTLAPFGQVGTWLLDPTDLTVVAMGGTAAIVGGTNTPTTAGTINAGTIVSALDGTNVNLQATNSITVNAAINASANIDPGNLTLTAPTANLNQPITLQAGSTLSGTATTVNVGAAGTVQNGVDVVATGGTVNLAAATYTLASTVNIAKSLTLNGISAGSTIVSGNNATLVFEISGAGTVANLNNLSVTQGSGATGGGIFANGAGTVSITNSTLSNNSSDFEGGGIYNNSSATTVNVTNSTLSGNSAAFSGGGIYNAGTLTVNNSTFSGNITTTEGGGGLYNAGPGALTVINSTFSRNNSGDEGGGIYNAGVLNVSNSTLSENIANAVNGGGGGLYNSGTLTVKNTIIAGNTNAFEPDVSGSFTDQGNNLIGRRDGSSGFTVSTLVGTIAAPINPLLAPLGNYGGTTQTHALLPGSPAIDAGGAGATTTDQRGIAAVGIRDIGAFESRGFTLTATSGTPQSTLVTTSFANPLVATVTSPFGEPVAGGVAVVTFTAPTSEATATLSPLLASINSAGQASVNATANALTGAYAVTATANGVTGSALFSLSNSLPQPTPQPTPQSTPSPSLPDPERRAVQQEPTPTYPTPPKPVTEVGQIARVDRVDTLQTQLESSITEQFTDHLELKEQTTPKSLPQIQDSLQKIEIEAGIKPALFYISLLPSLVRADISESDSDNKEPKLSYDAAGHPVISQVASAEPDLVLIVVPATGSPILRKVPGVTRSKVLKLALTFRNEVADPSKTLTRSYLPSAKQLYTWLIKPIEPELKAQGIDTLMFIMDTNLRFLPLAALYDDQDQKFLVEKYSIGLLPSLSLTDLRYGNIRTSQVLAAGASTFTDANQNPLLGVRLELSTILGDKQWQGRSLFDKDFTFNALQKQRQDKPFGIIHLATHGAFLPGNINESYIQLFDDKLRLDQIRKLGWNNPPAELVVLSACQMALGDENAELGFAGFAVKAGVKSALASLWNISDEGTIGLMSRFYEELRAVPTKAGALRQAQIAMLKGQIRVEDGKLRYGTNEALPLPPELAKLSRQSFSHPYYWSAFTMIGSPW